MWNVIRMQVEEVPYRADGANGGYAVFPQNARLTLRVSLLRST